MSYCPSIPFVNRVEPFRSALMGLVVLRVRCLQARSPSEPRGMTVPEVSSRFYVTVGPVLTRGGDPPDSMSVVTFDLSLCHTRCEHIVNTVVRRVVARAGTNI